MKLGDVTSKIPNSLLYSFLNTPIGRKIYKTHLQNTRSVTIQCDDLTFKIDVPSNPVHWWDDFDDGGCHEWVTTRTFSQILKRSEQPVVWDIGSKFGYFMMVSSNYTSPGNIHVFEADSAHASVISLNNRLYLENNATVNNNRVTDSSNDGEISGDQYLRHHNCPDLIKIDVDGPEADVVTGMSETITSYSPDLLIEIHSGDDIVEKSTRIDNVLSNNHYEYSVCTNHRSTGGEWDSMSDISQISEVDDDLLLKCSSS